MLHLLWVAVICVTLLVYFRQIYSFFNKHEIKHFRPIPLLGNMIKIIFRTCHLTEEMDTLYNSFPNERFVGRYEFVSPILMVRDIELVKKIAVKDFEHFLDHRAFIDKESDPLFGRNLISLKGQEWKDMRSTLSPAFTSSKIRLMVPFMVEVGDQMIKALKKKIQASGVDYIDVDCKDLTTRYANDVIASCAFGLKVDSHTEEGNEFYAMGKLTSTFTFRQILIVFGYISFPKLMKSLKITLFTETSKNFFRNLVLETIKDREIRNINRPDMIHLLMEAKKGKLSHDENKTGDVDTGFATVEESAVGMKEHNREWSDDDLVAQALLFLIGGFDTVSTAMSFLLYELAVNPEVQERLVQEIRENDAKNGGKFDYNSIQNMVYLDMVVSELLRLWPPGTVLDRLCVKDYNMGKPNSGAKKDFILRKGSGLHIPVWSFHRDAKNFPEPHKFDPERFSEQNRHNIKPFAYIPFGLGPRNCIASRFALCEVKVMAYQLLQHIEVSPCQKTCIPAQLAPDAFNIKMKSGHWLKLKIRK